MIALDTETTGLDFWHGSRPYLVTTCDENGDQTFFRWDVNPETREVDVLQEDLDEIELMVSRADGIVGQNLKFDVHALTHAGIQGTKWPWSKTQDTLIAGHLLASSMSHNLTDMAIQYLGVDIEPFEKALEKATQEARRWCRTHLPSWAIAKQGRPDMPSVKEKTWKVDAWLPATLRNLEGHGPDTWDTVLEDYANADSGITMALWDVMQKELHRRDLWEIYLARMQVVPVIWGMEYRGITCNQARLDELRQEYKTEQASTKKAMLEIAARQRIGCEACSGMLKTCSTCGGRGTLPYALELPKSGNNGSLLRFIFDVLQLQPIKETETGNPSLDKETVATWLDTLPEGEGKNFITALSTKRKRDTSISYLDAYERFWNRMYEPTEYTLPSDPEDEEASFISAILESADEAPRLVYADWLSEQGREDEEEIIRKHHKEKPWRVIHPSLNQTGTDTLRMSMSNPNAQNVDKHPDNRGFSLRRVFGPAPGREWWPVDYQNIELRIPAFESGEQELIDVFLKPKDPPYYGSYHLAIFDVLHPELFKKHGKKCKDLFESTWYQWIKNGNFAILYGAMQKKADQTYHVPGAYDKIRYRFPKMAALSDRMIAYAEKNGYVETIPDKTVNPRRGYPLLCSRTEYGRILPTVPLNYHVQSTAMYCTAKAMVRCDEQLREWQGDGFDAWIAVQVHDEIVFDFPAGGKRNLPRVKSLISLMCQSGDDIGVPLTAAAKWCPNNWAEAKEIK